MKIKGVYEEVRKVTFPHRVVKSHGDHTIYQVPSVGVGVRIVKCDGTVKGAQG